VSENPTHILDSHTLVRRPPIQPLAENIAPSEWDTKSPLPVSAVRTSDTIGPYPQVSAARRPPPPQSDIYTFYLLAERRPDGSIGHFRALGSTLPGNAARTHETIVPYSRAPSSRSGRVVEPSSPPSSTLPVSAAPTTNTAVQYPQAPARHSENPFQPALLPQSSSPLLKLAELSLSDEGDHRTSLVIASVSPDRPLPSVEEEATGSNTRSTPQNDEDQGRTPQHNGGPRRSEQSYEDTQYGDLQGSEQQYEGIQYRDPQRSEQQYDGQQPYDGQQTRDGQQTHDGQQPYDDQQMASNRMMANSRTITNRRMIASNRTMTNRHMIVSSRTMTNRHMMASRCMMARRPTDV
jgi:hypothetical protein